MTSHDRTGSPGGLAEAVAAYVIWGFMPLYLLLVSEIPAFEFIGLRILWTVPFCLLIVAVRSQWADVTAAFRDRKTLLILVLTASLLGCNWFIYIWAIQQGQVLATSIAYYISPLLNVLLGTWLLGETLSHRQWAAAGLAAGGVALLLAGALASLWISLGLALTFAGYGLARKTAPVGALPGLTVETLLLAPIALCVAGWFAMAPAGSSFGREWDLSLLIILGGLVTSAPILLFALAVRKMDLSTIGFIQFLAPTIAFILGLTVFEETPDTIEIGSFILIWSGCALFVADLFARHRA